jgi:hypothetical protein
MATGSPGSYGKVVLWGAGKRNGEDRMGGSFVNGVEGKRNRSCCRKPGWRSAE